MASKIKVDELETTSGSGTITLSNQLSGLTSASMPTGSVLQVVQDLGYNEYTTTSSSWNSKMTDVNCIITPSSTSSKILLMASTELEFQYNNTGGSIDFYRSISGGASTYNLSGETNGFTINEGLNRSLVTPVYLDSPSTTSAVTYSISMKYTTAGVGWVGLGGASRITTLIAMEIQG
jgi:hypothetical protein